MKNLKFKNLLKWLELHLMKFRPPPHLKTTGDYISQVFMDGEYEIGVNDINSLNGWKTKNYKI
jgi:hypothetical protein